MMAGGGDSCCDDSDATIRRLTDELKAAREEVTRLNAELTKVKEFGAEYIRLTDPTFDRAEKELHELDALRERVKALEEAADNYLEKTPMSCSQETESRERARFREVLYVRHPTPSESREPVKKREEGPDCPCAFCQRRMAEARAARQKKEGR